MLSEENNTNLTGPSFRSNSWFAKRLECPICFKMFNFNDIESHTSNCASKFDCNDIEVTYEEWTNEQLEVTIPYELRDDLIESDHTKENTKDVKLLISNLI